MSSDDIKEDSKDDSTKDMGQISKEEEHDSDKDEIQDTSLQQEKRRYINFIFCQISIGIISTYLYIAMSICMNMINRILFHTYKFRFNFTVLFCQQFFCLIFL